MEGKLTGKAYIRENYFGLFTIYVLQGGSCDFFYMTKYNKTNTVCSSSDDERKDSIT